MNSASRHKAASGRFLFKPLAQIVAFSWAVGVLSLATAVAQNAEWGIWVMRPDGSGLRMVAHVQNSKRHNGPRWSHDGKQILFEATPGSTSDSSIYLVNVDGSGLKRLDAGIRPVWSPDDKQIAFEALTGSRTVQVQNIDGLGRTQIAVGGSPSWSPDGSRIAFLYQDNVHVIDLVTGDVRALFTNPKEDIYYGFTWFADGKRLAIVARPAQRKPRQLLYVSADGEEHGLQVRMSGEMAGFISFSPDGKRFAMDSSYKVQIADVEGDGKPVVVPGQIGASRDPDWSPDGEWIVFTSSRDLP